MKQLAILYLTVIFTFQYSHAQNVSPFAKFLASEKSFEVVPVKEVIAHFSTGKFVGDESDEEEVVMITYFRENGIAHKLNANEIKSLASLTDDTYDATNDPMVGWFGSVLIRATSQKKKSEYWMITVMRAGPLDFRPIKSLHQDKKHIQLYQYGLSNKAYDAGFCAKSSEWEKRFLKIIKQTEQGAAGNPLPAE